MTWFETLTGFAETSADDVRSKLRIDGGELTSLVNNRRIETGEFTTPVLEHLRSQDLPSGPPKIKVSELVADVQSLHQDAANANAVFQVASQFNCLEMASPHIVPEDGVGIYQNDRTQGPACCLCVGGGTIFRNYFVDVNGQTGQTKDNQVDCLSTIGLYFENSKNHYWRMENGYCFPTESGLAEIEKRLAAAADAELDLIRGKLMVGVQSQAEVTLGQSNHRVTQVFCSALPIAYSNISSDLWNHFPRLILDAAYESTFYIAQQNLQANDCPKLYLTLVGGGVFGNKIDWILSSIERSLKLFAGSQLDVKIVSYGSSNPMIASFVQRHSVT